MALRPVCAWARGVGFGYFAGMVSVNKWSIYFHTPWGVHDHLRSLRTCAFTPLAAIVSQSHQPFKETKIRQPPYVRRGCHYHVRRGYVRLYESWFDSMSRWFDHELPQPRPTWLWLPRPFPPGSSSARRSSSAIHIHGGAGGDYPVCGCEQECATLRTSSAPPQRLADARTS